MQSYDAIIIGASLAGCTAGILLRRKGWQVLILDQEDFPRSTVCGEVLSPEVWPFLEKLGLKEKILAEQGGKFSKTLIHLPALPRPVEIPAGRKGPAPGAYGLSRRTLDTLLLQEAKEQGCQVQLKCQAQEIQRILDVYSVETVNEKKESHVYTGRIIINAAGQFQIWRKPRRRLIPRSFRTGFQTHFKTSSPQEEAVRLFFVRGGYAGLTPVEDGLVNFYGVIENHRLKKTRGQFQLLLEELCGENKALGEALKNLTQVSPWISCGPIDYHYGPIWFKNFIPVGDAAFSREPLIGHGITLALASSFLFVSLIEQDMFTSAKLSKLARRYGRQLSKIYHSHLAANRLFTALSPGISSQFWLRQLFSFPAVWKFFFREKNIYRKFIQPLE